MDIISILKSKHFIFPCIIAALLIIIIVIQVKYYRKKPEKEMCE